MTFGDEGLDEPLVAAWETLPTETRAQIRWAVENHTRTGATVNLPNVSTPLGWAVHSKFVTGLGGAMVAAVKWREEGAKCAR
jgi:hypothetical protein